MLLSSAAHFLNSTSNCNISLQLSTCLQSSPSGWRIGTRTKATPTEWLCVQCSVVRDGLAKPRDRIMSSLLLLLLHFNIARTNISAMQKLEMNWCVCHVQKFSKWNERRINWKGLSDCHSYPLPSRPVYFVCFLFVLASIPCNRQCASTIDLSLDRNDDIKIRTVSLFWG